MKLQKKTVIVLGAGASMPYQFPSGLDLLQMARKVGLPTLQLWAGNENLGSVAAFQAAVIGTLERSLDAMLETQPPEIIKCGKAYMAHVLLNCERSMLKQVHVNGDTSFPKRFWHEIIWDFFDKSSLDNFRQTPLTLVTYNYDRSVEFAIHRSMKIGFRAGSKECAEALKDIGPIHLHGQLGSLPDFPNTSEVVPFGGAGADAPTPSDYITAPKAIKIVHEPTPQDEAFKRARAAMSNAERIIFLGFSYGKSNMERLQLQSCVKPFAEIYACVTGFSDEQVISHVKPYFSTWPPANVFYGRPDEDIVRFFRRVPHAMI